MLGCRPVEHGPNAGPPSRGGTGAERSAGIAPEAIVPQILFGTTGYGFSKPYMAAPQQRDPGTDRLYVASVDPRLTRLCKARPSLPEHVILAVLALADSCRAVKADCLQPPSRDSAGSNRSERTGGRKLAI